MKTHQKNVVHATIFLQELNLKLFYKKSVQHLFNCMYKLFIIIFCLFGIFVQELYAAPFKIEKDDHVFGNPKAPVVIVEYSDYLCTHCKTFHDTLKKYMGLPYSTSTKAWVYRHLLSADNTNRSYFLALASECVAEAKGEEAFWKFSDLLFESQAQLEKAYPEEKALVKISDKLGVSEEFLKKCVLEKNSKSSAKVWSDTKLAVKDKVKQIPGAVIYGNGKEIGRVVGSADPKEFWFFLDNQINGNEIYVTKTNNFLRFKKAKWSSYKDTSLNFSLSYPAMIKLQPGSETKSKENWLSFEEGDYNAAKFDVIVFENRNPLSSTSTTPLYDNCVLGQHYLVGGGYTQKIVHSNLKVNGVLAERASQRYASGRSLTDLLIVKSNNTCYVVRTFGLAYGENYMDGKTIDRIFKSFKLLSK